MTGFNLFVSRYVDAVWNGREPEIPVRLELRTPDGMPIPDGALIVRRRGQTLFDASLATGRAEIALTPSDAPYTVALRRGTREETVMEVARRPPADIGITSGIPAPTIQLERDQPSAKAIPAILASR